jgi:hypothetical protein
VAEEPNSKQFDTWQSLQTLESNDRSIGIVMSPIAARSSNLKANKRAYPSFADGTGDFSNPEAEPEPKPKKHNFEGK